MNCPHCNSISPEGKKYCADCGAPLDRQTKHLETFVKTQIEESIKEKFRDQKLVDIETSQAIAERLHGWAKLFAFVVGVPIGLFLLWLSVAGFEKYSDFKKLVASIDDQVKPKIEQARSDAEQAQKTAKEAKTEAEDSKRTIEAATVEAKRQLGSANELAKNVKALSDRVSGLEQQTSTQIKGSSQRVDARVVELDQKIDAAAKDIAEQQKKLASTDELVRTLFSKGRTEYFSMSGKTANAIVVAHQNGAMVFVLLTAAPIYQTLELKWRVASQPRNSYSVNNNVVTFFWGESADNLKANPLEVTYVPDPTSKTPFKSLVLRDKAVFADDKKIMEVPFAQ